MPATSGIYRASSRTVQPCRPCRACCCASVPGSSRLLRLTVPLSSLTPVFATLMSLLILPEVPTLPQTCGILRVGAGALRLHPVPGGSGLTQTSLSCAPSCETSAPSCCERQDRPHRSFLLTTIHMCTTFMPLALRGGRRHHRALERVTGEVQLEVQGQATPRSVLGIPRGPLSDAAWDNSRLQG
jgi:hypothetical protein